MSLLPMYKKLTVSDSTDIVIDIAAEILFNVNMLCACERFKFFVTRMHMNMWIE